MKLLIGAGESKIFHLNEFAKALEMIGWEVKIVLDKEYSDGFPSRKILHWIKKDREFKKLIHKFQPDVVFVDRQRHFAVSSIKEKIPTIIHLRGNFWLEMEMAKKTIYKSFPKNIILNKWLKMGEYCISNAEIILPICKHLEEVCKNKIQEKNIQVLYQGINHKNWYNQKGMKLNHPCIGFVQSANIYEKTREMLILAKVMKKFPNITFYWVGDGPYKNIILPTLKKFENFVWLGQLEYPDKIRQFFTEIDFYGLISGLDMAPLTLLEAQLMQKPVIATNVGGISELLEDGVTGFLVKKNDEGDLEEKIKLILNEKLNIKMGKAGREFVKKKFDWSIIALRFTNILENYFLEEEN